MCHFFSLPAVHLHLKISRQTGNQKLLLLHTWGQKMRILWGCWCAIIWFGDNICLLISISINKCHGKLRRAFISNRCLQIFTSSVDVQFSVCNFYVTLDLTHLNMSQRNAERADLCFVLWPVYPPVLSIWMISNLLLSITLTELP